VALGSLVTIIQRVWGGRADHLGRPAGYDAPTGDPR